MKLPMPFLGLEQIETTELHAMKPEIRAQELREDRDLEQAICEAQKRDTATDKRNMQQIDRLWLKDGQIYILADTEVKLRILEAYYDRKIAGHLGQDKTLELITWNYTWPGMREFINEYVRTCDTCARNKTSCCRHHGQLHLLLIPTGL